MAARTATASADQASEHATGNDPPDADSDGDGDGADHEAETRSVGGRPVLTKVELVL